MIETTRGLAACTKFEIRDLVRIALSSLEPRSACIITAAHAEDPPAVRNIAFESIASISAEHGALCMSTPHNVSPNLTLSGPPFSSSLIVVASRQSALGLTVASRSQSKCPGDWNAVPEDRFHVQLKRNLPCYPKPESWAARPRTPKNLGAVRTLYVAQRRCSSLFPLTVLSVSMCMPYACTRGFEPYSLRPIPQVR